MLANASIDIAFHDTYYVVAQLGHNKNFYYAFDYMLGTMFLGYYLLFMLIYYLLKIDVIRRCGILIKVSDFLSISGENNNKPVMFNSIKCTNIQSAENCKDFSETIRQISNFNDKDNLSLFKRLAGIIDGSGNFDIRKLNKKLVLKAIRIKLNKRDVKILTYIQNTLHIGRIKIKKNKPHCFYIINNKEEMLFLINNINGLIRLKVEGLKKSCDYLGVKYREADYNIKSYDPYLAGLVDTDGTIVYNYTGNRIECNLEFKYNKYTSKLNLDNTIPYYKPSVSLRKSQGSITFRYQTVKDMVFLYDYFMKNRLYSDFKFYRVSKIKDFIVVRHFKNEDEDSAEFKIYLNFILDFIQYQNPL